MLFNRNPMSIIFLCILFYFILLIPTSAISGSNQDKIFVTTHMPPNSGEEAKAVARHSQFTAAMLIDQKYPCAETITQSELSQLLEHEKQRELLSGSDIQEGDLKNIGGATDAKYLLNITVMEGPPGMYTLSATMADIVKGKIQAKETTTVSSSKDMESAVRQFIKQFVDHLGSIPRFSKDKCEPTNPWAGYISYEYEKNNEKTVDSYAVFGKATDTITESTSHHITVQIGWNEEAKATFNIREINKSHIAGKYTMNCSKKVRKSGTWDIRTEGESTANDKVSATVGVSGPDAKGKYHIGVNIPATIKGSQHIIKTNRDDGGCGKPVNTTEGPFDLNWTYEFYFPGIDGISTDPNSLSGSIMDIPYKGAKISWSLKRTPMRK